MTRSSGHMDNRKSQRLVLGERRLGLVNEFQRGSRPDRGWSNIRQSGRPFRRIAGPLAGIGTMDIYCFYCPFCALGDVFSLLLLVGPEDTSRRWRWQRSAQVRRSPSRHIPPRCRPWRRARQISSRWRRVAFSSPTRRASASRNSRRRAPSSGARCQPCGQAIAGDGLATGVDRWRAAATIPSPTRHEPQRAETKPAMLLDSSSRMMIG